jgi:DNA-binding CsgD family transcriptional regulator
MPFDDSTRSYFVAESFIQELARTARPSARPSAPAPRRRARRQVNYRSASRPATIQKQARILALLETTPGGLSVAEIGEALGISRQLALYHVKKLAAALGLVMQLEPCLENGGLQFRCWDERQLARRYARRMQVAA